MSEFKDLCPLNRRPCLQNKALLRKHLVAFGVNCTMSTHATDEALIMLRRESFSIVFLDEMAGPLKPLQFLKMLRGDLNTSDVTIPVVLVSSGVDAARIATARDAGMNDVICEPVSVQTIERKLHSLLAAPRPLRDRQEFRGTQPQTHARRPPSARRANHSE